MLSKTLVACLFVLVLNDVSVMTASNQGRSYLAPFLNKKYTLFSSDDNWEEIMKALGVGFLKRKLGNLAKPVLELKEKNGEYTLSSESVFKNVYTKFRIGEEFDEVTADDREARSIFTQDKNKLIQVQKDTNGKTTVVVREFTPEEVRITVKVDDIVCIRVYRAM